MKLTKDAARALAAMPDWSATYEIRDRVGFGRSPMWARIAQSLVRRGLAEHGAANNTFRITEAGRLALQSKSGVHVEERK